MATSADWWDYRSGEMVEKFSDAIWTVTAARQVNNWRIKISVRRKIYRFKHS
ncbi:hypothetical protein P872_02865 [Rhodonellum psychrophilum GCM71 = DSM 17998]|uniref:Uncharacterized protein n=1 Tax=Rhodonellum psychrophilum GCM71 = DSM 17998 TaxID=1123057 RepID=U5BSJ7_9BACT|nr:hypothetical protein P872_02865 [Rhodonellum psychrophilum GCM71 = DSM 17998]